MELDLVKLNELTDAIIAGAIKVHRALGPGLLESAYTACPSHELRRSGLGVTEQQPIPLQYGDVRLDCGYRLDVVVNDRVILEIKSVKQLAPIHEAQMQTYLKLTGYPAGLLINFNVALVTQGIKRRLNPRPARRFLLPEGETPEQTADNELPPRQTATEF